jgi:hypothetical protein
MKMRSGVEGIGRRLAKNGCSRMTIARDPQVNGCSISQEQTSQGRSVFCCWPFGLRCETELVTISNAHISGAFDLGVSGVS